MFIRFKTKNGRESLVVRGDLIYLELIFKLSLLVALSIVSNFIEKRWPQKTRTGVLLQGSLFGGVAVLGMLRPLDLGPGLIFDGRSIMVSLCALYFGPIAAAVAGAMTILCRIVLGGTGILTGVLVIISSTGIGLLTRSWRQPEVEPPSSGHLYLFGLVVHIAMLALMFTLPGGVGLTVVQRIGLPVILMYPLATILAGKILSDQVSAARTMSNLQETKRSLEITLQSIGDAVIATSLKGDIVLMNPVAETLTGWTRDEARNRPLEEVFRIVNEKTREEVENPVRRVVSEGLVVGLANHTLLIGRDGKEHPIADSGAPIRNERNEITGAVLVFRDQTRERLFFRLKEIRFELVEFALHHTLDELLTKALDEIGALVNSPIGFYHFVEADGKTLRLQQWSTRTLKEFCEAAGKGEHYDIENAGVWADCVREKKPVVHNEYATLPHKKGLPEGHAEVVRELVVPVIREGEVVAVLGVGNKPAHYTEQDVEIVTFLADVTWHIVEHKKAEEERVLLEANLQHAMKMEAVGRLAGGMAHDFNNLLTVIIGNVANAREAAVPSETARECLAEANKAAEMAARLVQRLLAFSRKQIVEPKVLNLNDHINEMHAMLVRLIGENIELQTLAADHLGAVKIDPGQLEQILVNLVVNSRDAMPDGGKITIETSDVELDDGYCSRHPYVKPGKFVMMAVCDSGHGMTEEVKSRIFEPFFTTKEKGRGTGLGLAMIYGSVKQAGGSIEVYSEAGTGTTFKVYLPRVEGEGAKPVKDEPPPEMRDASETILIVEDDDMVRKICVRVLVKLGYRILEASNGNEAMGLARAHRERIDLLLTDVVMPGMNGPELARLLQEIHPEAKVLFASGYTENAIVHHGVLNDGVSFIGKPYPPSALAKKVREVLDRVG